MPWRPIPILGREFEPMWQAVQAFKTRCPIPVREIHTDNGAEFMNMAFIRPFGSEIASARLTRGRPGFKNDNRRPAPDRAHPRPRYPAA